MEQEKRFRVTLTLDAVDLTATALEDAGSCVEIIQRTVGALTRHEMEKRLSETMVKMGDDGQAEKRGGK